MPLTAASTTHNMYLLPSRKIPHTYANNGYFYNTLMYLPGFFALSRYILTAAQAVVPTFVPNVKIFLIAYSSLNTEVNFLR